MGSLRAERKRGESPRDPLLGTVINGKFRVAKLLARGGMGRVYRAEQVPLGRPVALKVLRSQAADDISADPNFQKRFFLEASILSKLQHPNIVTLYDYGRIEGITPDQYFMAMEYLAGDTLSVRIRSRGAVQPQEALGLFRQIARGLREAHRHGAIHRDLKPENMMLVPSDDGTDLVKLVDFGIGKMVNGEFEELTQEGVFVGSPKYMAPEQVLSDCKIDERTDVYSFGVIMFEVLSGKLPFDGDTSVKMMMAHCGCPVPSIASRNPDVRIPPVVEDLVRHALEKEPDNRPSGMDAVLSELRACEEQLLGGAGRSSPSSSRPAAPVAHGSVPPPGSGESGPSSMTPEIVSLGPSARSSSQVPPSAGSLVWRGLGVLAGLIAACAGTAAPLVLPHRRPLVPSLASEAPRPPPSSVFAPESVFLFELPGSPLRAGVSPDRDANENAPAPSTSASAASPEGVEARPAPRAGPQPPRPVGPRPAPALAAPVPTALPPPAPVPDIKTTR